MKHTLTLIACLLSMNAMGQTGQTFPGEFKLLPLINSGISCAVYHADGICDYNNTRIDSLNFGSSAKWAPYTIKGMPVTGSWTFATKHKTLMTITDQKTDSTYHVWIDKKAITWTSDSTFILKRKP